LTSWCPVDFNVVLLGFPVLERALQLVLLVELLLFVFLGFVVEKQLILDFVFGFIMLLFFVDCLLFGFEL
jgi:hypothetical protein